MRNILYISFCLLLPCLRAELLEINDGTTFVEVVDDLKSKAFSNGSNAYVTPTLQNQNDFYAVASSLWTASSESDFQNLTTAAAQVGYNVLRLIDGQHRYVGLIEQLAGNQQQLGWGSYFVRQGDRRDALVQAPHPLFDTHTPGIAATAFEQSQARGFLMAGAHRHANGAGTADVAHLSESIFMEVHEAWNGTNGENTAWQVHGFDLDGHGDFPADSDAVLSNGTGGVSNEIVVLDMEIEALAGDWVSYAYNTLDVNDPLNQTVNGGVDGETFGGPNGLGGTTNEQQKYSTALGGTFVHIELEQSFRLDGDVNRQLAADAISNAIIATTPLVLVPELGSLTLMMLSLGLGIGICSQWRR